MYMANVYKYGLLHTYMIGWPSEMMRSVFVWISSLISNVTALSNSWGTQLADIGRNLSLYLEQELKPFFFPWSCLLCSMLMNGLFVSGMPDCSVWDIRFQLFCRDTSMLDRLFATILELPSWAGLVPMTLHEDSIQELVQNMRTFHLDHKACLVRLYSEDHGLNAI